MRRKYIINGRQLVGEQAGVQRYLHEVLRELDGIARPGEIRVAVPKGAEDLPAFRNLEYVPLGHFRGILWEQLSFAFYLFLHRMRGVNLCTAVPLLYPFGINSLHDVMLRRYRVMRSSLKLPYLLLLKLDYFIVAKFSERIITVSNESRNDICNFYGVPWDKVVLARSSWQRMGRISPERPELGFELDDGRFYLALSSNRAQKNFVWVERVAERNPGSQFVIVGGGDFQQDVGRRESGGNVHYTGYLPDANIKYLYERCRAFLFPSVAEGFGMPPMEALSCGAKVVCSSSSCLPEIYGNDVYYINPYDYGVDLEALLSEKVWEPDKLLSRYSWQKTARVIYNLMVGGT